MQPIQALNASRIEAEIAHECEKIGWTLERFETGWLVHVHGLEIGTGFTPREAYLAACKAHGQAPF